MNNNGMNESWEALLGGVNGKNGPLSVVIAAITGLALCNKIIDNRYEIGWKGFKLQPADTLTTKTLEQAPL